MSAKASQLLQKAGQSLHNTVQALNAASQVYAAQVPKALVTNPFALETEQMMEAWKSCSRLTQEVAALDDRLKDLFSMALNAQEAVPVPMLQLLTSSDIASATDVKVKVKSAAPRKSSKLVKTTRVAKAKKKPSSKVLSEKLPGNAEKLLEHLKTILNAESFIQVVQKQASQAAGIPNGSVTASLNRLKALNLLKEGKRGEFKLVSA